MNVPRHVSMKLLALLTLVCVAAALPPQHAAQSAPAKQQSPNGKIVYVSDQAGDPGVNDIYTMDADGKHETRLTTNPADDYAPVWSPQGDRIAFVSNRRGPGGEIYLMDADGNNQLPLRTGGVRVSTSWMTPKWSPDGTRLAYADGDDIYVIEVATPDSPAGAVNVSAGKALTSKDLEADWSPDGLRLVVRNDLGGPGNTDLYVVSVAGIIQRTQLTSGSGLDSNPRWSPDGTLIAYVADRSGTGIYVVSSNGGAEQKVSDVSITLTAPAWSPDSLHLAYAGINGSVYTVERGGTNPATLADATGTASSGPFWSPDGQKVAFQNGFDIHVVSADGSRRATNYTKTKRAAESASSWQRLTTQ